MLLQSWQIVAILVIAGVFGFGIGRTFGESRAWKQLEQVRLAFDAIPSYCEQEAARFAREPIGFTADEQEEEESVLFRLGQRVSVQDIGFGTVVNITPEWEQVRVEIDGDVSYWFDFSQVAPVEGFTADEQAAIAESMTMEQDMARQFARHLTEGDQPIAGIRYEEEDEPIHTYESPFCEDETCPCHFGHVVDGRILVEQEVL